MTSTCLESEIECKEAIYIYLRTRQTLARIEQDSPEIYQKVLNEVLPEEFYWRPKKSPEQT